MVKDDVINGKTGLSADYDAMGRRKYLAALSASGVIAMAGCLGGDDDGNGNGGDDDGGNGNGNGNGGADVDASFTGFIADPPSDFDWNILSFRTEWPREMYGYCLDMLAYHDTDSELQPQVAADWGWDDEEFWVELRDDVYWSDGEQITAEDVFMRHEANFYLRDRSPDEVAEEGDPESVDEAITGVEIDGQTGRLFSEHGWFGDFYMEQWVDSFLTHPTNGEVYADSAIYGPALEEMRAVDDPWSEEGAEEVQDIYDDIVDDRDLPEPTDIRTSGAWKIDDVREDSVILAPNEYHWNADQINFGEVELVVQTDQNATWSSLQGDHLDNDPGLHAAPAEDIIDAFPDHIESHSLDDLAFSETILVPQGNHPILGRLEVRRAIMHAIDREVVAQNQHAYASSAPSVPVGLHAVDAPQWYDDELEASFDMYEHDLDKATEYLESIGFTQEDGEWYTDEGDRFGFELLTDSGSPNVERTVESQLRNFGIDVVLSSEESAIVQERKDTGDFEVVVDGWVGYVEGKWHRGLQQSARRRMWGFFDEEQVQAWIEDNDHIEDVEYDWTFNIEGFELEDTREFTIAAPPVGEPDSDEMVDYEIVYLDLLWQQNVDNETREEIMQSLMWVYNYHLTMLPITLTHNIAFQNHRDWDVPSEDTEWVNTGPGSTFSLMNRGMIQANPDGQH